MCDQQMLERWAKDRLSRREFGVVAGLTALTACAPTGELSASETSANMELTESGVSFATQDGTMDAFFVHPAEGKHPAIIFWPDIASIRESKRIMARQLAGEGYAVLVLNPYYRDVEGQIWEDFADFAGNGGWPKAREMRRKHTANAIMADAKTAVAWLDSQEAVDKTKGIGTEGYCMGGPLAVWSAAGVPSRIAAAASFHGGGLVGEDPQSPYNTLAQSKASFLIAVAKNDDAKAPEEKEAFSEAASVAGRKATVKVYDGDHGWTVPDSPVFAAEAATAAYADKLALYAAAL